MKITLKSAVIAFFMAFPAMAQIQPWAAAPGTMDSPAAPQAASSNAADSPAAPKLAFRVGKVTTMREDRQVINNAVVLVKDGRIEALGPASEVKIPDGYRVYDFPADWLVPGLVDCHNHTAGSLADLNDMVYLANPGLRTLETIEAETDRMRMARAGGITTVLLIPGSGTNLSGFGTVSRTSGDSPTEMVVRSPGSLKIAQAGNPERYWWRVGRMMMNYNTRQTLEKARDYAQAWEDFKSGKTGTEPEFNLCFDEFRGLFAHAFPVSVHTQIYQVVMTTVDMLGDKLGLRVVLDHSEFDAWKLAPLILRSKANIYTIQGPRQYHFDRTQCKMQGNAHRWWQGGIRKLGINTDAPVVPEEELPYQAAMACFYGWRPYEALEGLTRIPAGALQVDDRIGTIEPGKLADFCIWTGDPVDPRNWVKTTVQNGELVYEASVKRRF